MQQLNFSTIFVDIDATLIDPKPGIRDNAQVDPFTLLVAKTNEISCEAASDKITRTVDKVGGLVGRYYPFGILDKLGITAHQLWLALAEDAQNRFFMYDDAKALLVDLKEHYPQIKVFTATTNPQLIIYAKLKIAGLADRYSSPYLHGAFGGEEVYPGGKACPEFYTALLKRTGADPETTLMIGDHPKFDLALAQAAGIKQVVLPRREQSEDWVLEPDGGLYVKRLDLILQRR
jgi:FMN phosphatase YigB (HAD superfamily)